MADLDKLKRHLGASLLVARERAGLTQAEVSSQVGVVPAVYGRIERGGMMPSVPTLYRICIALGLSANAALGLGSEPLVIAAPMPPPQEEEDSPELRRLARLLPLLSPDALRCMSAIATAFADKKRENEDRLRKKLEKKADRERKPENAEGEKKSEGGTTNEGGKASEEVKEGEKKEEEPPSQPAV